MRTHDIRSHGAVGDGVTNDAPAIQAPIGISAHPGVLPAVSPRTRVLSKQRYAVEVVA